jgi:hypothetical protein
MRNIIWVIVAALATLGTCALLVAGRLPLGVHGQWEWGRIDEATSWAEYLTTGLCVGAYVAFVVWGALLVNGSTWTRRGALLALVLGGCVVQMTVQQVGFGLAKWPFVLFNESSSGYYTAAKRDVKSAGDFLSRYDQIQTEYQKRYGPLHLATHPPGLVLLHYGALRLCESNSGLTRCLLAIEPQSVRDGFRAVAVGPSLPVADQSSIWLVAILSQLASALTVLPIYALARRGRSPVAAWFAAALWPLVPAVTVFMPKSDVLYPLFAVSCVMLVGGGRTFAARWACGLAAGVVLCAGMFLTFGLVSVFPMVILTGALSEGLPAPTTMRAAAARLTGFVVGFLASVLIVLTVTGHNLPATWWRCFRIHATFYDLGQIGATRTYWPWIAFNLAEFAVAAGIPLMLAAMAGTVWLCGRRTQTPVSAASESTDAERSPESYVRDFGAVAAWWFTVLALDLSGKNLGEIARLWMFLMPLAAVAAAAAIERFKGKIWLAYLLLILQAIQTIVFAANVQGFYDPASVKVLKAEGGGRRAQQRRRAEGGGWRARIRSE